MPSLCNRYLLRTGLGAVFNTTKVEPGSSVAVFGLGANILLIAPVTLQLDFDPSHIGLAGAVGLSVVQAAKLSGATRIIGVDVNSEKEDVAREFGITDFVNPRDSTEPIQKRIVAMTKWGVDYTYVSHNHSCDLPSLRDRA